MSSRSSDWVAVGSLSVLSTLMFLTGPFMLLYLAPLQFLYGKTDGKHLAYGLIITAILVGALFVYQAEELTTATWSELAAQVGAIAALGYVNLGRSPRPRAVRLLIGAGVAAMLGWPAVNELIEGEAFTEVLTAQLGQVEQVMGPAGMAGTMANGDVETLVELGQGIAVRAYAVGYVVLIGVNWAIGTTLISRQSMVARFRVPRGTLTVLGVALAGAVADVALQIGGLGLFAWNLALGILVLYAAQGFGVLQSWAFARGPAARLLVPLAVVVLLLIPVTGGVVALALPLLGLAEERARWRDRWPRCGRP